MIHAETADNYTIWTTWGYGCSNTCNCCDTVTVERPRRVYTNIPVSTWNRLVDDCREVVSAEYQKWLRKVELGELVWEGFLSWLRGAAQPARWLRPKPQAPTTSRIVFRGPTQRRTASGVRNWRRHV